MKKEIPITLITGYLGSGKTTLINHILQNENQKKIASILDVIDSKIEKNMQIRYQKKESCLMILYLIVHLVQPALFYMVVLMAWTFGEMKMENH